MVTGTDEGATMVEYALLVTLIALALIGAVLVFSGALDDSFRRAADSLINA